MLFLLLFGALFLAYSNGANDNFKGVATLFGTGTTDYTKAISWATITTFAGSMAAIFLAGTLVRNFSGKGLVVNSLLQSPQFAIAVAAGAGLTVFAATKIGMPISTTHSLVGSLFGAGVIAMGTGFNFGRLGGTFLMPLFVSPFIAAAASIGVYLVFRRIRLLLGISRETCVCVGDAVTPLSQFSGQYGLVALEGKSHKSFRVGNRVECVERYQGSFLGMRAQKILDALHFLSAGIVSFARGLNDTPKIMGLLLIVHALDIRWGMLAVAAAMAAGGLLNARKVGETVSKKITPMNHGQGFTANLVSGLLVTTASFHGMPVSTTHVSVGSLFGIGTLTGKADFKVIGTILVSWLFTLPAGAVFGGTVYWVLNSI